MNMVALFNTLSRRIGMHREISFMSEKHGNILNVVVVRETNMEIVTENHNRAS